MRFDSSETEDDQQQSDAFVPESIVPKPDPASRAIRMRLMMLFASLILVIILMKEAGKPERWKWMGFDEPKPADVQTTGQNSDDARTKTNPAQTDSPQTNDHEASANDGASNSSSEPPNVDTTRNTSISLAIPGTASPQSKLQITSDVDYPRAAVRFWAEAFRKLNPERQQALLRGIKSMRQSVSIPEASRSGFASIVGRIQKQRAEFHQELFDRLAVTPESSPEKSKLSDEFYASKELWTDKIQPAFIAAAKGDDFTVGQQQAIERLQLTLDDFLFQQVQDKTSIGWSGDSAAWIRLWEIVENSPTPIATKTTRIELIGQPDAYRGKPVRVEGWIRSAKKETLRSTSQLGFPEYHVMWMRPQDSKLGPINVYVKSLPDDFPKVTADYADMNENVIIDGYFFKNRTYLAADKSVQNSPVVLADSLTIIPPVEFTSVNYWQPSREFLIGAFLLIPLIATAIAWGAFRMSQVVKLVPSKKSAERIKDTLDDLTKDPNIKSDRERIMALYDADID